MERPTPDKPILCPSAQPDMEGAQVFGVLVKTPDDGLRVGYLNEPQPITPDLVTAAEPVKPPEVLRIAAPCMGSGCMHFDGSPRGSRKCSTRWSVDCRAARSGRTAGGSARKAALHVCAARRLSPSCAKPPTCNAKWPGRRRPGRSRRYAGPLLPVRR